jgi:hypothetical protein
MGGSLPDNLDEATSTSFATVETIELLWLRSMRFRPTSCFAQVVFGQLVVQVLYVLFRPSCYLWLMRPDPYKQDEYMALMDKFQEEKIPLAVAVVDMDW